uniref:5-hydroxyisourate hydrolase n=1 Tax=Globisporangium ultimum (strain ATCC 200006 / CBS 805.95 / DAOM BR144) TaxID=431595 RepID=K3WC78_GLOUD
MSTLPYKSPVTSHVLDTSRGCPAANMKVELQALDGATWHVVSGGVTNADGRVVTPLVPEGTHFLPGTYRMVFYTQQYFEANGVAEYFYPNVVISFLIKRTDQHYHVPLLINPFGYSTYRGS